MTRQKKNHYDTPTKAKIQGAHQYLIRHAIAFDPRTIFRTFNVSKRSSYEMIQSKASARTSLAVETRKKKRKATDDQLKKIDNILQNEELKLEGKRYTWKALAMKIETNITDETMKLNMRAVYNYHKCLACIKSWLIEKQKKNELIESRSCWINILKKRTDITYDSAMKFILTTNLKDSCVSYASQTHDIVEIAYSIVIHHLKKIANDCIVESLLIEISNQIFTSTKCRTIATKKWHMTFTSLLFSKPLSNHDWNETMISFWKKTMIQIMTQAKRETKWKREKSTTIWIIISTARNHLIYQSSRIADNQLNSTFENSLIGTTAAWGSWSLRNESGWVRNSSTSELIRCLHGYKRS